MIIDVLLQAKDLPKLKLNNVTDTHIITNDAFYMKTDTSDNACGSTQMLSTGAYQTSTGPESIALYGSYVETLYVDIENHRVRLEAEGKVLQTYIGSPLPRKDWREGCPTNTSIDKQETWALLADESQSEQPPIFLFAVCQGSGVVLATDTKTVVFQPVGQAEEEEGKDWRK